MKRTVQEIIEIYKYDSFAEFEEHYEQMLKEGYEPNSDSCKPDYYYNHDLDSYVIQYSKRTTGKNLSLEDLEKIHDSLMQVESVMHEINTELIESRNYSDLQAISLLKLKLDEVENVIIDAARELKSNEKSLKKN